MKFVYPDFLFALAALAIPIIIHLFNFKKFKRVEFSNVAFLREIKQESKSKSRLKEWLILLSRLLAITFLVLAFAQPYVPVDEQQKITNSKAVSIYLDNSFSMNSTGSNGRLLDMAKQYVYKIMDSYPAGQKFQLFTSDLNASSTRSFSKESVEEQLAELDESPNSIELTNVLMKQTKWLNDQSTEVSEGYVISDFQGEKPSVLDLDTNVNFRFLQLSQNATNNLFVDSVWIDAPSVRMNEVVEINYQIRNTGNSDLNGVKLTLDLNGEQIASSSVNVAENAVESGKIATTLTEPGFYRGVLNLEDYPIEYDNSWYFSFNIKESNRVLVLNEKDTSSVLGTIYDAKKQFVMQQMNANQVSYDAVKSSDVVVLNAVQNISQGLTFELKSFIENGGVLCILPNLNSNANNSELLQNLGLASSASIDTINRRCNGIKYNDPFYKDVFEGEDNRIDLPQVYNRLTWTNATLDNSTTLLTLEDGKPLLLRKHLKKGSIFLWASNLKNENSNLSEHSVFLLSLYKIGLATSGKGSLSYSISNDIILETNYSGPAEFLSMKSDLSSFIPEMRSQKNVLKIWPHENAKQAGFYELRTQKDSLIDLFAINYSRSESNLTFWKEEQLEQLASENRNVQLLEDDFENFEYNLTELTNGIKYWKWMIALTLLMLMIEILLIKLWRN